MKNEDGANAGTRNLGRLALALIPWALGIGASVWLGVWIGVHQFRHTLSQEERAAVYTGAQERPKTKIAVEILERGCIRITRADVDGEDLLLYAENGCNSDVNYLEFHWQAMSSNGIVIADDWTNQCPKPKLPGDQSECRMQIKADDRTLMLRVWATK